MQINHSTGSRPPNNLWAGTLDIANENKVKKMKFLFIALSRSLKLSMNTRSTIKSFKPLFAQKMDYDFTQMDLLVTLKGTDKKVVIPIDKPLNEIDCLKGPDEAAVEIEILYEGG